MLALVIVIACLAVVVLFVGGPIFRAASLGESDSAHDGVGSDIAELEASRDAKLQEIRDAELDWRTGKLSEEDWRSIDRVLRAQAAEILRELDAAAAPATETPVN